MMLILLVLRVALAAVLYDSNWRARIPGPLTRSTRIGFDNVDKDDPRASADPTLTIDDQRRLCTQSDATNVAFELWASENATKQGVVAIQLQIDMLHELLFTASKHATLSLMSPTRGAASTATTQFDVGVMRASESQQSGSTPLRRLPFSRIHAELTFAFVWNESTPVRLFSLNGSTPTLWFDAAVDERVDNSPLSVDSRALIFCRWGSVFCVTRLLATDHAMMPSEAFDLLLGRSSATTTATTTATTATTTAATSTTAATTAATTATTAPPLQLVPVTDPQDSSGALVGGVVGGVIAALLLLAVIAAVVVLQRRRRESSTEAPAHSTTPSSHYDSIPRPRPQNPVYQYAVGNLSAPQQPHQYAVGNLRT